MNPPEKGEKLRSPEKNWECGQRRRERREGERGGEKKMGEENMKIL